MIVTRQVIEGNQRRRAGMPPRQGSWRDSVKDSNLTPLPLALRNAALGELRQRKHLKV